MQLGDAGIDHLRELVGCELGVGFEQNLAGAGIDYIGCGESTLKVGVIDLNVGDLRLLNFLQNRGRNLASGVNDFFSALGLDAVGKLQAKQVGRTLDVRLHCPVNLLVANRDLVDGVERAENVLIRTQAESAQKNCAEKLALAIDTDIQRVLLVVLELHP